jgi:hypothetical protein
VLVIKFVQVGVWFKLGFAIWGGQVGVFKLGVHGECGAYLSFHSLME